MLQFSPLFAYLLIVLMLLEKYHLEKVVERAKVLQTIINFLINNKELIDSSYKIYLFGSYVSGNYTEKSDIDILFVNENRKLIVKTCREISSLVGKNLNPLIYTRKKFKSELQKKEPLLDSITNKIKNRAIIKG